MGAKPSPTLLAVLDQLAMPGLRRTALEIARASDREVSPVRQCLTAAAGAGLVEEQDGRYASTRAGRAVRDSAGGASPPRRDLRQRLWTALRRLRKATVGELVTLAASGEEADPSYTARFYLRALGKAGYVREMPRRGPAGVKVWLLVRDTGARAPRAARDGDVSDPNTGEVHHV